MTEKKFTLVLVVACVYFCDMINTLKRTDMIINKSYPDTPTMVEITSRPIGFITCDKTLGNNIEAKSMILYFAIVYDIPYFLLKESSIGDAYIVETGDFSKGSKDYNSRCIMGSTEYLCHIPEQVMRLLEYGPAKIKICEKV